MSATFTAAWRYAVARAEESPDTPWLHQPRDGVVTSLSWGEALEQARRVAAFLAGLRLPPGSPIAIFSRNCASWLIADLATWIAGHVSVPIYPSLTAASVRELLVHSGSKLVFVGPLDGFDAMRAGLLPGVPCVRLPGAPELDARPGAEVADWAALLATHAPMDPVERADHDPATVIYTSGSTGRPKGVVLSFEQMLASALGVTAMMNISAADRMLSYLPLAHVYERWMVQTVSLYTGMQLFFSESMATFADDRRRARPTIFVSVPRLWLKFQQEVFAVLDPASLAERLDDPVQADATRREALAQIGLGHVRFAISGSAPIAVELLRWYRDLGIEIREGYGMTENFAYSHITRPGDQVVGSVGKPYPDVQCRLSPSGEVLVRSPATMLGYLDDPAATDEVMTDDGFLRTGDLGAIDADGRLRITGRRKELFKTTKGKYVAPAPIEKRLVAIPGIATACVRGAGRPQPHAIVTLLPGSMDADTGRHSVEERLASGLAALNRTLDRHERLAFVAVAPGSWTPGSGMLTPTMKVRRSVVDERFAAGEADWYAAGCAVIWAGDS